MRYFTVGAVATAIAIGTAIASGGGGEVVTCDQTVTTRAALVTSLGNLAGTNGDTVCVTADLTGALITASTVFTSQVRVIAQPADQTIDMVEFHFGTSAKITIEGFNLTGDHYFDMGNSSDAHIIRNYCHDQNRGCVNGNGATNIDGTWILGNRFERILYTGGSDDGYGMVGRNFTNLRVEYNYCDGGSDGSINYQADCFQIDNADTFTFIGNNMVDDSCLDCDITHNDSFMFWNGSSNGTIRNNVAIVGLESLLSPDGSDTVIDNNLVVQMKVSCVDAHPNGTSGDVQPLRFTITHNTLWDCNLAFTPNDSGWSMNGALAGRGGNVMNDNVFPAASCVLAGFGSAPSGNVISAGNPCSLNAGTNDFTGWVPNWNGTNYAGAGLNATYQPTNLPGGYSGAGYHPAPFGPDACDC